MAMTRIALISDTHLPERLPELPRNALDALDSCELVLHAGDVGDMRVLDRLADIAPTIAVRGNDGGTESAEVLPLEQIVAVDGTRILLWHGHFEDRSDELAWRRAAGWTDIFDRIARRGRARGTSIVVTGHTHIPLAVEHRGVLLVNPGALAPGNVFLVQTLRSVAILEVQAGQLPRVQHVDVDADAPFEFAFDPSSTFSEVAARVQASLLASDALSLRRDLDGFYRTDAQFRKAWLELAHRVWREGMPALDRGQVAAALAAGGAAARSFASAMQEAGANGRPPNEPVSESARS